jgi:excisionase family DNA binding protein
MGGPAGLRALNEPADRKAGRTNRGGIIDLMNHPEPFVTVADLAAYWCVSADTVYRDIAKGALRVYRVGSSSSIRIRLEDARSYGRPDDSR